MTITSSRTTADSLTAEQIDFYQTNGFVRIPSILTPEETIHFYDAATKWAEVGPNLSGTAIFQQFVNVWTLSEELKALTLHSNVGAVAEKLAGINLLLWHDQILIKKPHNQAATEWHQDQPYWPHQNQNTLNPITCWIALEDVPVERGCMTFIPESQNRRDLRAQNLMDSKSLFSICPELEWEPRVTIPLKAGDCTFHHGRCAHMATPNFTDKPRVAHAIIFTDATTRYDGAPHVVTQPLGLNIGDLLEGSLFPKVG